VVAGLQHRILRHEVRHVLCRRTAACLHFGGFWAILFFGGYRFFGLEQVSPLPGDCDLFKALLGYWIIMWIKYT
jgi:hypothetical protein